MFLHNIRPVLLILAVLSPFFFTNVSATKETIRKKEKIHLQWAICEPNAQIVLQKLGHADKEPFKVQNVTYFDSSPPKYSSLGFGFRTKLHSGVPISMVKYRFDHKPDQTPEGSECVWDRYGYTTSYTCSLGSTITNTSELWSSAQQEFASNFHDVDWKALTPYGPYLDPKWKFRIHGHKVKLDDAMAVLEDGTVLHLIEVEMKAKFKKADKSYERITDHLLARGVVLCGEQISKTTRLFNAMKSGVGVDKDVNEQVVFGDRDFEEEL